MAKIKQNDNVIVITGKDNGKTGKVIRVFKDDTVLVEGINMKKKHVRKDQTGKGQIIEMAFPLHISNIAIVDPKTKKASRVGYKMVDKQKVRIAKASGQEIK
jgi:large subunit ribosomal protein L24